MADSSQYGFGKNRNWRHQDEDWDSDENFSERNNPDVDWNDNRFYGRSQVYDRQSDYNRTRQWRGSQGQNRSRQDRGQRDTFGDEYGQNYGSGDWNLNSGEMNDYRRSGQNQDWDRDRGGYFGRGGNYSRGQNYPGGENYGQEHGYGRNPNYGREGEYDRGRDYGYNRNYDRVYGTHEQRTRDNRSNRGQDEFTGRSRGRNQDYGQSDRSSEIYDRDWYNWDFDRDYTEENDYGRDRNWGGNYGGQEFNPTNRGQSYRRGGMRSDYQGSSGQQYRSAGMGSDYGADADYDRNDMYRENNNYGRGDVGYDSEGAFYQDLDEPINYSYWEVWDVEGPYRGVGPSNYQRTDERIEDEVCERLTNHGQVDASEIQIEVNNGEVTLRGTVPNREMKRIAEDAAEDITGVKDIHNEIKVIKQDQSRDYGRDYSRNQSGDYNRSSSSQTWENKWPSGAENSMAGQTNAGAGMTSEGATSLQGMENATAVQDKKRQLREGMEVIGKSGKVVGRVKEIRQSDFLVDRELARDVYIPYSHLDSVGAQAMLDVAASEVDQQGWEKPSVL